MPDTDELWGGRLASVSFDPVAWKLRFGVEVLVGEEPHRYELVLDGVTQWQSSRGVPLPWNYAEVTEVHVSEVGEEVLFEMVLWADDTSLSARCASLRVDRLA
jgi:hypothetical protein